MGNARNNARARKRKHVFHTKKEENETDGNHDDNQPPPTKSLRGEKIKEAKNELNIINFKLLKTFLTQFLSCPECHCNGIVLIDLLPSRMGYAHKH